MSNDWQPLSVRSGKRAPEQPHEGIPDHLKHPVREWLMIVSGWHSGKGVNASFVRTLANRCRIPIESTESYENVAEVIAAVQQDEELYLDVIDAALDLSSGANAYILGNALKVGGSVWAIREDKCGLVRRVSESAESAFDMAVSATDAVSEELRLAWGAAFGRNPDASDAWDHAIKAVEDLLIPILIPKVPKPNLGGVAGELKNNPSAWVFGVPGNVGRTNGETLEGLIRHIWPNPDRHGGTSKREPTQAEAEAVVQIAVLIVNLCRGRLKKVP